VLLAGALEQSGDSAGAHSARDQGQRISRNFGAAERYANELLYH